MSVRSRIINTLQANIFGQLVTVAGQLASVPLFLHFWGVERYGEWIVLSAIPAYLAFSDLGFSSAAANDMTMARARDDMRSVVATYQSMLALLSAVFGILLVASPLLGILVNSGLLVIVRHVGPEDIILVMALLAAGVGLTFLSGLVAAIYRCEGAYHRAVLFINLVRLAELVATAVCLVVGGDVVALAAMIVLTRLCGLILTWLLAVRAFPWALPGVTLADTVIVRALLRPAISFMAFPIGYAFMLQGFVLLVAAILGTSAVVLFTTMRTLARVAGQAVGVIAAAVWPELSAAFGRNDIDLARAIHRKAFQVTLLAAVASIGALAIFGDLIARLWTNGAIQLHHPTYFLMLIGMGMNALWLTSSVVSSARNCHQVVALYFLLTSGVALAAGTVMAKWFGMPGVAGAMLLGECVMAIVVLPNALGHTDDKFSAFCRALLRWKALPGELVMEKSKN